MYCIYRAQKHQIYDTFISHEINLILTLNADYCFQKSRKDLLGCVMFFRAAIKGLNFAFAELDS